MVLLASGDRNLQQTLGRFAAGIRVSTSKSEVMHLCWKTVKFSIQVGSESLPQVKEFKYIRALFTSDGKMDDWCGVCSIVDSVPDCCGEKGPELEEIAPDFSIHLRSTNRHLRSGASGRDTKNEISKTEMSYPSGLACLSL